MEWKGEERGGTTKMSFPNARHSLRQWSNIGRSGGDSGSGSDSTNNNNGKIPVPVPVAIELHNFLPPTSPPQLSSTTATPWRQDREADSVVISTSAAKQVTPEKFQPVVIGGTEILLTAVSNDDDDDFDGRNGNKTNSNENGHRQQEVDKTPQIQNINRIDVVGVEEHDKNEALLMPQQPMQKVLSPSSSADIDDQDNSHTADDHTDKLPLDRKTCYGEDSRNPEENGDYDHGHDCNDSVSADDGSWYRRPQHDINLLPFLRLDIVASVDGEIDPEGNEEEATTGESKMFFKCYSQRTMAPAIHPTWEHLDERIHVPPASCPTSTNLDHRRRRLSWWEQSDLYKSMRMKLYVIPPTKKTTSDDNVTGALSASDDDQASTTTSYCFVDLPLHPSFLHRIDNNGNEGTAKTNQNGSSSSFVDDRGDVGRSPTPDSHGGSTNDLTNLQLPPNAILVHYSDGSVRCSLSLFQILWDTDQLAEEPPVEDFSRFEDDVFKTLDHVQHTPQRRERTASSLLDQDQELDNDEKLNAVDERNQGGETFVPYMPPTSPSLRTAAAAVATTITKTNRSVHDSNINSNETNTGSTSSEQGGERLFIPFTNDSETAAKKQDLLKERELLMKLIATEHDAMEQDYHALQDEKLVLAHMLKETRQLEKETAFVSAEVKHYEQELVREEFYRESLSLKLIRGLSSAYPITLNKPSSNVPVMGNPHSGPNSGGSQGYMIRGLRLPVDIFTTNVPEEEVSASLGYCAHLVFMIAKYLNIPLRHRILCNSSRSAIQQDGAGVLPLFLGRLNMKSLEREQVDKALRLLGADVNCILMHFGILTSSHTSLSGAEDGSQIVMTSDATRGSTSDRSQNRYEIQVLEQSHILARIEAIFSFIEKNRF